MFKKYMVFNILSPDTSAKIHIASHIPVKQFSISMETLLTSNSNLILQIYYFVKCSPSNLNEGLIHNVMRAIYFKARGNLFQYLYFD